MRAILEKVFATLLSVALLGGCSRNETKVEGKGAFTPSTLSQQTYSSGGSSAPSVGLSGSQSFDVNGRVTQYTNNQGFVVSLAYNQNNQLIEQTVKDSSGNIASEHHSLRSASGSLQATYQDGELIIQGPHGRVRFASGSSAPKVETSYGEANTSFEDGQLQFHVSDHLGSVVASVSQDGVEMIQGNLPYGAHHFNVASTADETDLGFTGLREQGSQNTGEMFTNNNARQKPLKEAVFLAPDPLHTWDATKISAYHAYAYVAGNPTNNTDPSGYSPDKRPQGGGNGWAGGQTGGSGYLPNSAVGQSKGLHGFIQFTTTTAESTEGKSEKAATHSGRGTSDEAYAKAWVKFLAQADLDLSDNEFVQEVVMEKTGKLMWSMDPGSGDLIDLAMDLATGGSASAAKFGALSMAALLPSPRMIQNGLIGWAVNRSKTGKGLTTLNLIQKLRRKTQFWAPENYNGDKILSTDEFLELRSRGLQPLIDKHDWETHLPAALNMDANGVEQRAALWALNAPGHIDRTSIAEAIDYATQHRNDGIDLRPYGQKILQDVVDGRFIGMIRIYEGPATYSHNVGPFFWNRR